MSRYVTLCHAMSRYVTLCHHSLVKSLRNGNVTLVTLKCGLCGVRSVPRDRPGAPDHDGNKLDPAAILLPQGPQEWCVLLLFLRGYQANTIIPGAGDLNDNYIPPAALTKPN